MASIIFIAPSQAIAEMARKVIAPNGWDIMVAVASFEEAKELVQNNAEAQVVIARGGTAAHLNNTIDKTIVHITAAISDILLPVGRLRNLGFTGIGLVVRSNVLDEVAQNLDLTDMNIIIRPCDSDNAIGQAVQELAKAGVKSLVTDKAGAKAAQPFALTVEFLDSGLASITKAMHEAVKIVDARDQARRYAQARAKQILNRVTGMHTAIEQAAAAIEQLSASSQQLAAASEEVAGNAKDAKEKIKSIVGILEIIRHVARQTNLLGLNAAIEAARVGESGRGFAVVANEVRKLADESNRSARNIDNVLAAFQTAVGCVLTNAEQSSSVIQDQAKATQEIAQMLENLRSIGEQLVSMTNDNSF
jgi:hypothetical protein